VVDYGEYSLWDLAYCLDQTNLDLCSVIDPYLSDNLKDIDDLMEVYYYLCCGKMHNMLPKTKIKVNELLSAELKQNGLDQKWQFKNFVNWLDKDIKASLSSAWLNDENADLDDIWMVNSSVFGAEANLKILSKLVQIYKKKKSVEVVKTIESTFNNINKNQIDDACILLEKSTPAVLVTFLKRSDIKEKYTLKGLKALSKLSKQRELDIKIDFNALENLGPKSRLDAMKQLLGMFDKYYQFKQTNVDTNSYGYRWKERRLKNTAKEYGLPFTTIPNRSDIEKFLFPCSLKYNDEVVAMVNRFDELISKQGEK